MLKFQTPDANERGTISDQQEPLWSWDLDRVASRVRNRLGWSEKFTALVELEYRRFMALAACSSGKTLGMRGAVDEFWHEHILFTRDYAAFCESVAGRFLHHEPGTKNSALEDFRHTLSLLEQRFGYVCSDVWFSAGSSYCGTDNCATCSRVETRLGVH